MSGDRYAVSLPYVEPELVNVPMAEENPYPGFTVASGAF